MSQQLNILGIRGIPAAHGGFETFAANFAPHMRDAGWKVKVYCQAEEGVSKPKKWSDEWQGIHRVHIDTKTTGALATIEFDLRCVLDVSKSPGIDLVLGYNTALFVLIQRLLGRRVVLNMDGIEWKRAKWGSVAKAWFWANEWIGAQFSSTAISDHPEIDEHLKRRGCKETTVIPYGSAKISSAPVESLTSLDLKPNNYFISIARIEPENSIVEIVTAFSQLRLAEKLVVLGKFEPNKNPYHKKIFEAASKDVIFPGAIYVPQTVQALRFHALAYLHGHQVGGTNPSLVEALGAGNPIIAHDNKFNRWVAGPDQMYFSDQASLSKHLTALSENQSSRSIYSEFSYRRHAEQFTFDLVHKLYQDCIENIR